jgi:hypothetical protein
MASTGPARFFLFRLCFVASLGGLLFGFDTAVISGTFSFVEKQFLLTKFEVGWFASAFIFPWYVSRLGMASGFWTFAAICFVATIFFWRLVPETKNKSLEEIEAFWLRSAKSVHREAGYNRGEV